MRENEIENQRRMEEKWKEEEGRRQ